MNRKILFVDDEPNVLDAFSRSLRKDFTVFVAESGADALSMIDREGPFAVILSDMRMPGMDGIELLIGASEIAPETVRIMLTGNADQQTAIKAVNEGSIFRFLTKPCPLDDLTQTLNAGVEQYRLVTAEKQLLEETLHKSIQVLIDILAIVNPTAFTRSNRVKKIARDVADRLGAESPWEIEIAAMLSQIGCVTVPEEILQKIAAGMTLTNTETGLYHKHPQIGHDLIVRIPRLERVARIIQEQTLKFGDGANDLNAYIPLSGARILKAVLDYDRLTAAGHSPINAFNEMSGRNGWYDPEILAALRTIVEIPAENYSSLKLDINELRLGMFLDGPLMSARGSTLLPAGQEITPSLILRLRNLLETGIIAGKIQVNMMDAQNRQAAV